MLWRHRTCRKNSIARQWKNDSVECCDHYNGWEGKRIRSGAHLPLFAMFSMILPEALRLFKSKQDIAVFKSITADELVEKVKSLIEYSLHDEYVSRLRKMMTIEQFRSKELSALYSRRYRNRR